MSIPTTSIVLNRKRLSTTSTLWHEAVHRSPLRGRLVLTLNSTLELGSAAQAIGASSVSAALTRETCGPISDRNKSNRTWSIRGDDAKSKKWAGTINRTDVALQLRSRTIARLPAPKSV